MAALSNDPPFTDDDQRDLRLEDMVFDHASYDGVVGYPDWEQDDTVVTELVRLLDEINTETEEHLANLRSVGRMVA
jgi:hypothetical protein